VESTGRRGLPKEKIIQGIIDSFHSTVLWRLPGVASLVTKSGWLRRFAEDVAKDTASLEPWNMLKKNCPAPFLIEHLYMYTVPGKTAQQKKAGSYKAFNAQIEKMIRRYNNLQDDVLSLYRDSFAIIVFAPRPDLHEELQKLRDSQQRFETLRDLIKERGWYKPDSRNFLYLLSEQIRYRTGHAHVVALTSLIASARNAHGPNNPRLDEAVGKQIQRLRKDRNAK
jgi:hypothetical protein